MLRKESQESARTAVRREMAGLDRASAKDSVMRGDRCRRLLPFFPNVFSLFDGKRFDLGRCEGVKPARPACTNPEFHCTAGVLGGLR